MWRKQKLGCDVCLWLAQWAAGSLQVPGIKSFPRPHLSQRLKAVPPPTPQKTTAQERHVMNHSSLWLSPASVFAYHTGNSTSLSRTLPCNGPQTSVASVLECAPVCCWDSLGFAGSSYPLHSSTISPSRSLRNGERTPCLGFSHTGFLSVVQCISIHKGVEINHHGAICMWFLHWGGWSR